MTSADDRCRPLACSLSPDGLRERQALIDQLLARGLTALTTFPGGVQARFVTGPEVGADLDALVQLEARCCPFSRSPSPSRMTPPCSRSPVRQTRGR
jgi:hypothetical protein